VKSHELEVDVLISLLLVFANTNNKATYSVLTPRELGEIPWNVLLLFSRAMSIGFCLWKDCPAQSVAVNWLVMFENAHWMVFVLSIAFFVLEVILYASLVTAAAYRPAIPGALSPPWQFSDPGISPQTV
jgi:sodium-dependent dicarboxylate transporter 2/3/5